MRVAILLAVSLSLCAGCAARRGEPISKPLAVDTEKLARGEKTFMAHCNQCHPGGWKGLGFAISNKPLPDFMVKAQVRAGAGAMPAFSGKEVSGEDLDALVAYIDLLQGQKPR